MVLEDLLPYLAGIVGVPIINFAKDKVDLPPRGIVVLSVVISAALGIGAVAFFGDGFDVLADGAKAFAAATFIYKLL